MSNPNNGNLTQQADPNDCCCPCVSVLVSKIRSDRNQLKGLLTIDTLYFTVFMTLNLFTCLFEVLYLEPISPAIGILLILVNIYLLIIFLAAGIKSTRLLLTKNIEWEFTRDQYLQYIHNRNFYMVSQKIKFGFEYMVL